MRFRGIELGLLILAAVVLTAAVVSLKLALGNPLTWEVAWIIGGFIGIFAIAHISLCFLAPHADQVLLPVAALLNGLGIVMIYRLDQALGNQMASRQVIWTVVGVAFFVAVLVGLKNHRILQRYSYILGVIGLLLLALPIVWPWAPETADADIWISIGGLSVQPGEFSKLFLLLFFAQLLTAKRALFTTAGYWFLGLEFPRLRDLAPILAVWGVAIIIMGLENDFGPALLLFGIVLGMMYLATGRASWLLIGLVLMVIGGTGLYMVSAKIQTRFTNFIDPVGNYENGGYQLSQALFGMSFGGIGGTGLGQGYPQEVPVAFSDFILAAIGEELGLTGLMAIILLFGVLITRGFRIGMDVKDSYGKLVAGGSALAIMIQVFVVVAGISALMPMTGLTTPFMSQGGSSLLANYILLALLVRISENAAPARATTRGQTTNLGAGVRA
ncbi:MAG: FtsW/RodA/SpoVE family cell cycle protein [Corynebacterium sp.]|nr:FtsW/RodA/SpoVE family cell cycle protein [Corynebacterium sp.]